MSMKARAYRLQKHVAGCRALEPNSISYIESRMSACPGLTDLSLEDVSTRQCSEIFEWVKRIARRDYSQYSFQAMALCISM